jgi:hypothetical protein
MARTAAPDGASVKAKQVKWAVLSVVVVLAVTVGVILATQRDGADSASDPVYQTVTVAPSDGIYGKPTESASTTTSAAATPTAAESPSAAPGSASSPDSSAPASSVPVDPAGRKPTNVPMTKLAPGEKAPQFVIFSFDGVGSSAKMHEFLDAAAPSDARFTGFLTGLYVIDDASADAYQGPGAARGASEVGFGGDKAEVIQRVKDLNEAYLRGNEIGTHYNGHFCGLGENWSTAEWNSELDQFFDFMTNWKTIDGITDAPDLVFPAGEIKGGRTQCLVGQLDQLEPAWQAHDMTYDSSMPAPRDGIFWPERLDSGIWEFYMPQVYSAGLGGKVTAMDYNFWVKFNGAQRDVDAAAELTPKVLDTYRYMYDQAFNGNRAPVLIANHFNNWAGNAFNPATAEFMRETCGKPETYCATYQDVIAWMELQDPAVLQDLQDQGAVAYQP